MIETQFKEKKKKKRKASGCAFLPSRMNTMFSAKERTCNSGDEEQYCTPWYLVIIIMALSNHSKRTGSISCLTLLDIIHAKHTYP